MTKYNEDKIPEVIDDVEVVQDISIAIDCLNSGQTIARYEFGDSMQPILSSGQFCKLVPLSKTDTLKQGDCVFAQVNGSFGTHMIWVISEAEDGSKLYCIATTQGNVIGWTDQILAKAYGIPHFVKEPKKLKTRSDSLGGFGRPIFYTPPVVDVAMDGETRTAGTLTDNIFCEEDAGENPFGEALEATNVNTLGEIDAIDENQREDVRRQIEEITGRVRRSTYRVGLAESASR